MHRFRNGDCIPRPQATAIQGDRPNEGIHADFLYMGPANGSNVKYLLLIKDDLSSYSWIHPCNNAERDAVTIALLKWMECLGCMEWLVTDQGSRFIASLMTNFTKKHRSAITLRRNTAQGPKARWKAYARKYSGWQERCSPKGSYLQGTGSSSLKPFKWLSVNLP